MWDYAGEMTLLRYFWDAAVALDPDPAAAADERSRMRFARQGELGALCREAGLRDVEEGELVVSADYESFDDLWEPFTLGVGPAGEHAASLDPERQRRAQGRLPTAAGCARRPVQPDARAWFAVANA